MGQFVNENEQLLLQESSRAELRVESVSPDKVVQAEVFEASDLLVAYLADIGVEYVFGVPGGAIEPLYNAWPAARGQRDPGPSLPGMRPGLLLWLMATIETVASSVYAAPQPDPAPPT